MKKVRSHKNKFAVVTRCPWCKERTTHMLKITTEGPQLECSKCGSSRPVAQKPKTPGAQRSHTQQ